MARYSVDLGTPGGRGVWLDRSSTRSLSYADDSTGDPAGWAPRDGYLLAQYEGTPPTLLPAQAADDIVVHQVWRYLPDDTKQAFGSRFSQIVVRVLRGLRTAEVEV